MFKCSLIGCTAFGVNNRRGQGRLKTPKSILSWLSPLYGTSVTWQYINCIVGIKRADLEEHLE